MEIGASHGNMENAMDIWLTQWFAGMRIQGAILGTPIRRSIGLGNLSKTTPKP